jgi:hypothetical protein
MPCHEETVSGEAKVEKLLVYGTYVKAKEKIACTFETVSNY